MQRFLVPRKIGELELDFENPTWKSNWDFEEFTVEFIVRFSQTRPAFWVLTCPEELVAEARPHPGSAARVLSAGAQRRSAPKVPQGSAMVFLRISLIGRFRKVPPKGKKHSGWFRRVPRRFREGSARFRLKGKT